MKAHDDLKRLTVSADVRERIAEEYKEFKDWKENKRENEQIIEIFGKKLRIIYANRSAKDCIECALHNICWSLFQAVCETPEHKFNRYFVEIQ